MSVKKNHIFFKNLNLFNCEISNIVRKLSPGSKFLDIKYRPTTDGENQPVLDLVCALVSLPNGGMRNLKRVPQLTHSVFMTGRIKLHPTDKNSIIYYGTEINYCKTINPNEPNKFECITGFHYDALVLDDQNPSKDNNHPILHAQQNNQCGTRLFCEPEYSEFKGSYECNFPHEKLKDEIRSLRIPTPQMDMLSAIIMIIADYLVHSSDEEHKKIFTEFLNKIYNKLIPLSFSSTKKINSDFANQQKLMSIWYPL
ncbi:hypothetical protein I5729_01580 [Acinetobacter bereziniae]|uniref:hypothetical protein n=1 Tax=Acinetobacter bereziniae TaxID=106648 RepID=UPI001901C798|nr:hypothetical protein [Acinetobacter bereziniae]MBJ9947807.1 hypothetical protein [Acinetobacter bereziniae]